MSSYESKDIIFETEKGFIVETKDGYEVYEIGATCSTRRVTLGVKGMEGLLNAKYWLDRIENENNGGF